MQKENIRIYNLARELNVETDQLLRLCRQAGIDVTNPLTRLDPDQRAAVMRLVKQGPATARVITGGADRQVSAGPPGAAAVAVIPAVPSRKVRDLNQPRPGGALRPGVTHDRSPQKPQGPKVSQPPAAGRTPRGAPHRPGGTGDDHRP
jgi:hypothetical protein